MFFFLYQTLFHVKHSRKKYYANIYHLTQSKFYILLQQKSCAKGGLEILCIVASRLQNANTIVLIAN